MMYRLQKWISPVILAVICQQAIRLVTDISIDNTFWVTPSQHLRELIISPPFFYLIDRGLYLLFVKRSTNKKGWKDIVKEYGNNWAKDESDIDLPLVISKKENPDTVCYRNDFTNIILVFDYERHDPTFSEEKIKEMLNFGRGEKERIEEQREEKERIKEEE